MLLVSVKYWHAYLSSLWVLMLSNVSQFRQEKCWHTHLQQRQHNNILVPCSSISKALKCNKYDYYEYKDISEELKTWIFLYKLKNFFKSPPNNNSKSVKRIVSGNSIHIKGSNAFDTQQMEGIMIISKSPFCWGPDSFLIT